MKRGLSRRTILAECVKNRRGVRDAVNELIEEFAVSIDSGRCCGLIVLGSARV